MTENSPVPSLHPSDIYRAQPGTGVVGGTSAVGGDVSVVRDARSRIRFVRAWLPILVLLCLIPPIAVWWRAEPGYLTGAVWIIALGAALLACALVLAVLWLAPIGRSGTVLEVDDDGLSWPSDDDPEATISHPWSSVQRCDIVGRFAPSLIIAVREPDIDSSDAAEDLAEPEHVEYAVHPIDFENDPPPAFVLPSPQEFAQIRGLPTPDQSQDEAGDESDDAGQRTEADNSANPEVRASRRARWNEHHYGTPHVISLWGTSPPRAELAELIASYSDGRFGRPKA